LFVLELNHIQMSFRGAAEESRLRTGSFAGAQDDRDASPNVQAYYLKR
jgi:hypothetical protein